MASDLWNTDPQQGSTHHNPIPVSVMDLEEWNVTMIPVIQAMYSTDPRNHHRRDNNNDVNGENEHDTATMITLPQRGVELRDLLAVLDYPIVFRISSENIARAHAYRIEVLARAPTESMASHRFERPTHVMNTG